MQRIIPCVLLAAFALVLALAPMAHAATSADVAPSPPHHTAIADDTGTVDVDNAAERTAVPNHCPEGASCSLWMVLAGDLPVQVNAASPPSSAAAATPWAHAIPPDRHPPRLTA